MNAALLEKILACPTLPSLPATALEVTELCRQENININQLARTICKDPALATKILSTVNSPYYGLRNEVATISHAVVLLGLGTVKSLALSFTLVGSLKDVKGEEFDPSPIWRRSLYAAIGARAIALRAGGADPEEAFLAGLLQDMGILALIQTLGSPYIDLLRSSGDGYQNVQALEQQHLQLDHTQVGEALAAKWNLPAVLAIPIRYHEDPSGATGPGKRVAYAVALGNKVAAPFLARHTRPALDDFFTAADAWFSMERKPATEILKTTANAAPQMGKLFELTSDDGPDIESILSSAEEIAGGDPEQNRRKAS